MKDQTWLGREIGGSGRMQRACAVQTRTLKSALIRLNKWFPLLSLLPLQEAFFFFPRDVCIHSKAVLFFFFFSPMTCPTSLNKRQGQSASYKTLNNLAFPRTLACSWSNLQFKGNTLSSLNGGWKTGTHCSDICGEEDCNVSKIIIRCYLLNGDLLRDE